MSTTIILQQGEWENISALAGLIDTNAYLLSSPNKPIQVVQSNTAPDADTIGITLNNWQPSVTLAESDSESIYAKCSQGIAYLAVNNAVVGSGGGSGGTTPLGAISPTVETSSTNIVASAQTNYMFIGAGESTVNIDISAIPDNRSLFMFTSEAITLTVNGIVPTAMAANTYVEIIKSAIFGNGFNILGG